MASSWRASILLYILHILYTSQFSRGVHQLGRNFVSTNAIWKGVGRVRRNFAVSSAVDCIAMSEPSSWRSWFLFTWTSSYDRSLLVHDGTCKARVRWESIRKNIRGRFWQYQVSFPCYWEFSSRLWKRLDGDESGLKFYIKQTWFWVHVRKRKEKEGESLIYG